MGMGTRIVGLALVLAVPAAAQKVIYVDHDAPGFADGTSWFNAYRDFRQAINEAAPGDQIWVAEGIYYPFGQGQTNPVPLQCDRSLAFAFTKPNIKAYGGFKGYVSPAQPGEASLADRPGLFLTTVLSGDIDRNSPQPWAPGPGSVYEKYNVATRNLNTFHILTFNGNTTPENLLDGFTIVDGNAKPFAGTCEPPLNTGNVEGGAARLTGGASPTFANCYFARNSAEQSGGAVYIGNNSVPTFIDCSFEDNAADIRGGAVVLAVGSSTAIFDRCSFIGNAAEVAGGTNSGYGGAVALGASSPASFFDCTFDSNLCGGNDGTLGVLGGGAIHTAAGSATIRRCTFLNNRTRGVNAGAGAIFAENNSTVVVENSLFSGNSAAYGPTGAPKNAGDGGAIIVDPGAKLTVVSSTFSGNSAAGVGGAILSNDAVGNPNSIVVRNSIFYGNAGNKGAGWNDARDEVFESGSAGPPIDVQFSCVRWGFPGAGNTIADPLFVSPLGPDGVPGTGDEDLSLAEVSPFIDRGNEAALPTSMDIRGNLRRLDGDKDLARAVDLGAYEFIDPTGFRFWLDAMGGAFSDPFRWDVAPPTEANGALFAEVTAAPYTVSLGANAVSDRLIVRDGEPTFSFAAGARYDLLSLSSAGTLVVGGPNDATLTLRGDGLIATKDGAIACIGDEPGDGGSLMLDGPLVSLSIGQDLCIGDQGAGELRILSGAGVSSKIGAVGDKPGSLGEVLIDGEGSSWDVAFFMSITNGHVRVVNGGNLDVGLVGALILPGGRLEGDATVSGSVLSIGEVRPGNGGFATLTIGGDYSQFGSLGGGLAAAGRLRVRVGLDGASPASDRLEVAGKATLAGGLIVKTIDGYAGGVGDSFTALAADSIAGRFDVAFLPGLDNDQFMRVNYPENGEVTLTIESLGELLAFGQPIPGIIDGIPVAAALADVDPASGDGPDLIVAVPSDPPGSPGAVYILFNAGIDAGGTWQSFSEAISLPTGVDPAGIAAADLDGDGDADFAVTHRTDNSVIVFLSDGSGGFTTLAPVAAGEAPIGIVAADLDGENGPDLAVASSGNDQVVVLLNDGGGNYTIAPIGPIVVGPQPVAIAAADLDGDGDQDLVTANAGSQGPEGGGLVFNYGNSGGIIFEPCPVPVGPRPTSISIGQVGGEAEGGWLCIFTNADSDTISIVVILPDPLATPNPVDIRPQVELPVGLNPRSVRAFDGDADGDVDIFVIAEAMPGIPRAIVLRQDAATPGQVAFAPAEELNIGDAPTVLLSADVDQDEREDLVAVGAGGGDGPSQWRGVLNESSSLACYADCEGDGDLDIFDFLCFQGQFFEKTAYADCEKDGDWDLFDFLCYQGAYVSGCP